MTQSKRYRAPDSFFYWIISIILISPAVAICLHYVTQSWSLAQVVGSVMVVPLAKLFEQQVERELRYEAVKSYYDTHKGSSLNGKVTIDDAWSHLPTQKVFKAAAYLADTDSLITNMRSANTIAVGLGALAAFAAAVGWHETKAQPGPLTLTTLLIPCLAPIFSMWAPAFLIVRRNNDLMQ